jgi:hypothetical protein
MKLLVGPGWLPVALAADDEKLIHLYRGVLDFGGTAREPAGEIGGMTPSFDVMPVPAGFEGRDGKYEWEGGRYHKLGLYGEGWYDLSSRRGEISLTPMGAAFLETFVRQVFIMECYRRGAVVFHGVAFGRDGRAVVSCGLSGSGKSTLAALVAEDFAVYSDEMNVVTAEGDVWGAPFRGMSLARVKEGGARLAAFTFHRPGAAFHAESLAAGRAVGELARNCFVYELAAADVKERTFAAVTAWATRGDVYDVTVPLDGPQVRRGFRALLEGKIS